MNSDPENSQREIPPDYIREMLQNPPQLLHNFHYEDVRSFLELGKEALFKANDVVLNETDHADVAYFVAKGTAALQKDGIEISVLGEHTFFSETFLFNRQERVGKVVCRTDAVLLHFSRPDVLNYFRAKPAKLFNIFTKNIIELQQEKINHINLQVFNLKKLLLEE